MALGWKMLAGLSQRNEHTNKKKSKCRETTWEGRMTRIVYSVVYDRASLVLKSCGFLIEWKIGQSISKITIKVSW